MSEDDKKEATDVAYRLLNSYLEQGKKEGDSLIEVDMPSEDDLLVVVQSWLEKNLEPVSVRHFADEYINRAHGLSECIGNAVINDLIVKAVKAAIENEEFVKEDEE